MSKEQTPEEYQAELAARGWTVNLTTAAQLLKFKKSDPRGEQIVADLEKIAKKKGGEGA